MRAARRQALRDPARRPGRGDQPHHAPVLRSRALAAWDKSDTANQLLNPQELAGFVETFQASGFTGGINWYRNFSRNWQRSADLPTRIDGVPCLMIMAEKDVVLSPAMADGMEDVISDLEKALVKDSGHWTQQEKPDEVNRLILDWMGRRFPK